jgi:hypothetical protein
MNDGRRVTTEPFAIKASDELHSCKTKRGFMAVAVQESTITDVDRVTAATLDVYARRHDLATEMPLAELLSVPSDLGALRAVVGATGRTVEIVLDAEVDASAAATAVWSLYAKGFQPIVLVALDRIGAAHDGLHGTPCRLQSWWLSEDGIVFGAFEST